MVDGARSRRRRKIYSSLPLLGAALLPPAVASEEAALLRAPSRCPRRCPPPCTANHPRPAAPPREGVRRRRCLCLPPVNTVAAATGGRAQGGGALRSGRLGSVLYTVGHQLHHHGERGAAPARRMGGRRRGAQPPRDGGDTARTNEADGFVVGRPGERRVGWGIIMSESMTCGSHNR
jgi:hypothetical protein